MSAEHSIAIITGKRGQYAFEMRSIPLDAIPEKLNGENGSHIMHVSMLSEQIARLLAQMDERCGLTETKIQTIAAAAALHDIGMQRTPSSLQEKAGTLTPLEYDLIKRHALKGEEIIGAVSNRTDIPGFKKVAREIARSHHERYDGAGYPDGLVGDQIPLSAQIVSIADAFDSLCRARGDKEAVSQETALEMIASGMCGAFSPPLIDCLMRAIEDEAISDVRNSLLDSHTVYAESTAFVPKKVLLAGNTGYVSQEFLDKTFPDASISVIGREQAFRRGKVKVYARNPQDYQEILGTYDFDVILYFASNLSYDSLAPSDAEDLRQFMKEIRRVSKETKIVYLSSLDAAFEERSDRGIMVSAKENLCLHYAHAYDRDVKVIRIPYLYNAADPADYLYGLFDQMHRKGRVRIREQQDSMTYFLSMFDLSDLLVRMLDYWTSGVSVLTVSDDFRITFGELGAEMAKLKAHTELNFTGKNAAKRLGGSNAALKKQYGWFSKVSIAAELEDEYAKYLALIGRDRGSIWDRFRARMGKYFYLFKLTELLLMFLVCEVLVAVTDSALFFSVVDFRLIFVVLMASVHGLPYGLGAAGLSSLAWVAAKISSGTNWMTIFYEPTNWLPFIFYFLMGAVCGYVKLAKESKIRFLSEENHLLEERLGFTREIYEDTLHEKQDLKKQIIGSRDSFGKIFEITRQLNSVDAHELYLKIVTSFEGILENRSISVYSVNEGSYFARLEVASRDMMATVSRSISLDMFAPVMEKIRSGEVYRNTDLSPELPMFACGIRREGQPILLIFLWQADAHQHSLYYVNLFRILCDLAQMSLLRAHDYSQALHEKQYIPGTRIQNADAFTGNLLAFRNLAERKVFQFQLPEIAPQDKTPQELSQLLQTCVRANDIIGLMPDGRVRILLAQAGPDDLPFVLPRFRKLGLPVTVLSPDAESLTLA